MTAGSISRLSAILCLVLALTSAFPAALPGAPGPNADAPLANPPAAVTGLTASINAGKLVLTWNAVTQDTTGQTITGVTYNVYRALDAPYFVPAAGETPYKANLATTTFTDPDAKALTWTLHSIYYVVKAVYQGLLSDPSGHVGAFDRALIIPGNVSGNYYATFAVTGGNCPGGSAPTPGLIQVIQNATAIALITGYGDEGKGSYNETTGAFSVTGAITDPSVCTLGTCSMSASGTFDASKEPVSFAGSGTITVKVFGGTFCTAQISISGARTG